MDNILVIFGNRNTTMQLYTLLRTIGVRCVIVPVPNQLSVSCGLSLQTSYSNLDKVLFVIRKMQIKQSYKIFRERKINNRSVYQKVI